MSSLSAAYAAAAAEAKARRDALRAYRRNADPKTVNDLLSGAEVQEDWFKLGEWRPTWGNVEFDDDACLKNVTGAGKAADGYFVPAGTILPLGAALPQMTVLKYGGYFPAGTSFPSGVLIPMQARMVNILPQETKEKEKPKKREDRCVVQ